MGLTIITSPFDYAPRTLFGTRVMNRCIALQYPVTFERIRAPRLSRASHQNGRKRLAPAILIPDTRYPFPGTAFSPQTRQIPRDKKPTRGNIAASTVNNSSPAVRLAGAVPPRKSFWAIWFGWMLDGSASSM
jgi:hypothetical protein